jgi:uncharacterized membrane protein YraQ (UPF0718 family)
MAHAPSAPPSAADPIPVAGVAPPSRCRAALQTVVRLLAGLAVLAAWWLLYGQLQPLAQWLTFDRLHLAPTSHLGQAVAFFLYDTPKVLMLLVLVVFGVGVVRSFFTPERSRRLLAGRHAAAGTLAAALLGVVTPFCSCSAVPLFIGFVTTGVPLGVTFTFLLASPMVNEVALALLFGLFGWRVAGLYLALGLGLAVTAGWAIGALRLERWVEPWVFATPAAAGTAGDGTPTAWRQRLAAGGEAVRDIVGRVWPYVVAGIAVGAGIHGYVPQDFMASFMGRQAWWSVPIAVLVGVPLYANAAGIIPVVQALLGKGAALGTVLAFMMAVIALSLPEMVILRRVLRPPLIATWAGLVAVGITLVGWVFNAVL